jgi:hypothetical protein
MKGKLQLLFTFLFYMSHNPDEVATSVSSAPTEWKLQLPDVQAPTCTGDFYSLPLLLPTTLKSFSVTKNLQTNSLSTLSKIKHSNPLCTIHSRPDHFRFSNLCMCLPSSVFSLLQILQSHISLIILTPYFSCNNHFICIPISSARTIEPLAFKESIIIIE